MALNNLERFVRAARNPLSMGTLFERDPDAMPTLLQILSASQHLSELLVTDPEGFDLLRLTEGAPVARQMLIDDICAEVAALEHDPAVLRRAKAVQAAGDAADRLRRHPPRASLKTVAIQISYPGRRILEAALRAAGRKLGISAARRWAPTAGRPDSPSWAWANSAGWN